MNPQLALLSDNSDAAPTDLSGVGIRTVREPRHLKVPDGCRRDVFSDCLAGAMTKELAARYRLHSTTILRVLADADAEVRGYTLTETESPDIKQPQSDRCTLNDIRQPYDVQRQTVQRYLDRHEAEIAGPGAANKSLRLRIKMLTQSIVERMNQSMQRVANDISYELAAWSSRVQDQDSISIAPGSELDQDLLLVDQLAPALVAWRALATAGEHAGMASVVFHTTEGGVFTKPFMTVARTVMVGAAKAIYILSPNDPSKRREHSLRLLRTEAKDLGNLASNLEKAKEPRNTTPVRTIVNRFQDDCERELVAIKQKPTSMITETDLLLEAYGILTGGIDDPRLAVMTQWNRMSGIAHARTWSWDTGLEDLPILEQYATIWSVPIGLLGCAWDLWNTRRGYGADIEQP